MIQTVVIYLFLLFSMMLLVSVTFKIEGYKLSGNIIGIKNIPLLIALLVFAFIFGMRYGVGVDHLNYLQYYKAIQMPNYDGKKMEPAFSYISHLFSSKSIHFSLYFAFLSFIQIFFIFWTFNRNEKSVLPFLVLTLFLGGVFLSYMNGIRQQIAFSIFVFSIEFIYRRKPIRHYLLISLAYMFHSSALLLVPIYIIFNIKRQYFKRIFVQIILLIFSLYILYQNYLIQIISSMSDLISFLGYDRYIELLDTDPDLLVNLERTRGLGFYILLIIDILLIFLSKKVKSYFSNSFYTIIYDLFFIGVIYGYITHGSIMLGRVNYFFLGFKYIVAAFSFLYLFKNIKKNNSNLFIFITLLSLYILVFIAVIYRMDENTSRFVFFWQENLYYLKI